MINIVFKLGIENVFQKLSNSSVAILTNSSGVDQNLVQNIDLLLSKGIKVRKVLAPEHGFYGSLNNGEDVLDEELHGIPVFSIYSENKHSIDPGLVVDIDSVVIDIQDSGSRPYTYLSSMKDLLRVCAVSGKRVVVCDRPNPLSGSIVDGPVLKKENLSFIGPDTIPLRYGMTVGELSLYFNRQIGADLMISKMTGYKRTMFWSDCMKFFIPPSLNLSTFDSIVNFLGLVLVESSNVSVGRGTPYPFRVFGYDGAWDLSISKIPGLITKKTKFRPLLGPYSNSFVDGHMLFIESLKEYNPIMLGLFILRHLYESNSSMINFKHLPAVYGSKEIINLIEHELNPKEISEMWKADYQDFVEERNDYLLYS